MRRWPHPLSQATPLQIVTRRNGTAAMAVTASARSWGRSAARCSAASTENQLALIFAVNLPVGILCVAGTLVHRSSRNVHREPFDMFGFPTLGL